MSMGRFMVTLYDEERRALWELAKRERRDPREQAALSIRHARADAKSAIQSAYALAALGARSAGTQSRRR